MSRHDGVEKNNEKLKKPSPSGKCKENAILPVQNLSTNYISFGNTLLFFFIRAMICTASFTVRYLWVHYSITFRNFILHDSSNHSLIRKIDLIFIFQVHLHVHMSAQTIGLNGEYLSCEFMLLSQMSYSLLHSFQYYLAAFFRMTMSW